MSIPLPLGPAGTPGVDVTAGQDAGAIVRRSVLPGGIRVLSENMPGVRSVSLGVWVPVGSRDETDGHHGSTHFLEHLLFKGTPTRTAFQIAEAFDQVGGEVNAATAKEHTCYYARVLDTNAPMALEVLTDMVTSALIDRAEFETERGVILEELAMSADDAHDVAHEEFAAAVFAGHPLERPIGGTQQTIQAVPRDAVVEHYSAFYDPAHIIVSAAGGVDHDDLCRAVTRAIGRAWDLDPQAAPSARRPLRPTDPATPLEGEVRVTRPGEQAHVILGCPGIRSGDDRRHAMNVLNSILGGGMSSRLFQEVRERRGLAYTTYSFSAQYSDIGAFGLYAGCSPSAVGDVVEILQAEWLKFAENGVTSAELKRAKGQLSGGMVLGMEDSFSRMSRLGASEISIGELTSVDESLQRTAAVTGEQVRELAAWLAAQTRSLVIVEP